MGVVDLHMSTALNDLVNARVVDSNMLSEVVKTLGLGEPAMDMPIWEVVLFLVLSAITYYRKELSSNRVHREAKVVVSNRRGSDNHHNNYYFSPHLLNNNHHLYDNPAGDLHVVEGLLMHTEHMDPLALAGELKHRAEELKHQAEEFIVPLKSLPTRLIPLLHHTLNKAMGTPRQGPTRAQRCEPNVLTECPGDVSRHIIQYLQPQEVLTLSQASSGLNELGHQNTVWRTMWLDRFGELWDSEPFQAILSHRHVHLKAKDVRTDNWRRFYFEFEWGWMDWLLAGYNREDKCLVGIHDNVYDLTTFLELHPGSKETILVHAGSDATTYFDDVGHSVHARDMMKPYFVMGPNAGIQRCLLSSVSDNLRAKKRGIELTSLGEGGGLDGFTNKLLEPLKELASHMPNVGGFDSELEDDDDDEEEDEPQQQPHHHNQHPLHQHGSNEQQAGSAGGGHYCCKCGSHEAPSLAPYTPAFCNEEEGGHQGLRRGMYEVTSRRWLSWWSCCGQMDTVKMPLMAA